MTGPWRTKGRRTDKLSRVIVTFDNKKMLVVMHWTQRRYDRFTYSRAYYPYTPASLYLPPGWDL